MADNCYPTLPADVDDGISTEIRMRANFEMSLFKGPNVEKLKQEFLDKLFFATNIELYASADALEQLKVAELDKLFGDLAQHKWERSNFIFSRASPYFDQQSFFNMHLVSRRVLHHLGTQKWKLNARGQARDGIKTDSEFSDKFLSWLCAGRFRSITHQICCYEQQLCIFQIDCQDKVLQSGNQIKEVKELRLPFPRSILNGDYLLRYFDFPNVELLTCNTYILFRHSFRAGIISNVRELELFHTNYTFSGAECNFVRLEKLTLVFERDDNNIWCFCPSWTAQHLREVTIKLAPFSPYAADRTTSIRDRVQSVKKIFEKLHKLRPDASYTLIVSEQLGQLEESKSEITDTVTTATATTTDAKSLPLPSYINVIVDLAHLQSVAYRPRCLVCHK